MPVTIRGFLASLLLVSLFALAGSPKVLAQRRPLAPPPLPTNFLASVKNLKCVFSVWVSASWKNGDAQAQVKMTDFMLTFSSIDAQEGTAQSSNVGSGSDIVARLSTFSLHFIEVTSSGSLKVTTVFNQESHPGKLKAVYAQHDYLRMSIPGFEAEPTVSQYYGECEVGS